MERIDLKTLDFSKLQRIKSEYHIESELFHDEELAYKIFSNLSKCKLEKKERKIELLHDGGVLPIVTMPLEKLVEETLFSGFSMNYITDSIPLFEFSKRSNDIKLFLNIIVTISKALEEIHLDPRDIIIGDLNFDNIIIDRNFNPHITDIDSCQIDGLANETIPAILKLYLYNRNIEYKDTTRNLDRFNLILCSLYVIFKKDFDNVTMYEFDKKSERLETLRNMRKLVLEMKKNKRIPEVPYLHELITPGDTQRKKSIIHVNTRKRI